MSGEHVAGAPSRTHIGVFQWRHAVALVLGVAALMAPAAGRAADADSTRALMTRNARRFQLGLTRPDRLQHASLSLALALGATRLERRPLATFAGTLAVGVAKELWDARHGVFDPRDLAADAIGGAVGARLGR